MADQAHDWTDEQIERLNRRLAREYSQAAMEMRTKLNSYLEDYEYANQSWKDAVRSGEATRKDYREWLASQASKKRYVVDMTNKLAEDALGVDKRAFEIINDTLPQVYAENANYAAYRIESGIGRDTGGFALYDQDTVRRLMTMDENDQVIHEVIPIGPPNTPLQSLRVDLDAAKDVRWNRQKFTSAITQSILQGESIPNTAKRLAKVLNMDRGMATRAARTAMTSAENAGRVDSYSRAKRIGIDLEQEWMATLDERTRASNRLLDGEHVPVGQKFSNGLKFPADPSGAGEEIWNCRCTLVAWLPNIENEDNQRWSRLPAGMTYEQWKGAKKDELKAIENGTASRYTNMGNPLWSQLGPVDKDAVASKVDELLSGAHGEAAQLWAKYESGLRMVDPTHTGGAFYRYSDRGVHLNLQRDLDGTEQGPLAVWFHEFGHNIDYLCGREWNALSTYYDSGKFSDTLSDEVTAFIKGRQRQLNAMLMRRDLRGLQDAGMFSRLDADSIRDYYEALEHISDPDWLRDNGHISVAHALRVGGEDVAKDKLWQRTARWMGLPERSVPIAKVREIVGNEITASGLDTQLALGDIFEGATRGKCQDTYGHGRSYWDADGSHLAKEAFAEFYSAECIYAEKPEVLDAMIDRLPRSYEVYKSIVEAMIGA
jgi:hypothetical protein